MASYFEIEQEGKISEIYEFEFYSPSGETDVTINANSSSGEDSTISNVKSLKNGSYIGYDREIGCSWVTFQTGSLYWEKNTNGTPPEGDRPTTLTDAVTIISITPSFDNVYYYRI